MKKQLYLLPGLKTSRELTEALESSGIDHERIHVAHRDHTRTQKYHLHDLSFLEEFDTIHSGERGFIVGIVLATLSGLSTFYLLEGFPISPAVTLFVVLITLGFSTWLGGLIGASSDNYRLQPFHDHIEQGGALLIIDMTPSDKEQVNKIMHAYPMASNAGSRSWLDNPFEGKLIPRKHF